MDGNLGEVALAVAFAMAVCNLSCGGPGLEEEAEEVGTGGQIWSTSLSSGTDRPQEEHLTDGRSWDMRKSGIVKLKRVR